MLQSEAALSLRRCLANVGGSMFRSQYLTKIGRPFTQEQPVIGEAELSHLLCITFSHSSPALPETMKSNRSPFFFATLSPLLSLHSICMFQRNTHSKHTFPKESFLKVQSVINVNSVVVYSPSCMTCFLLWNTKVGIMGLSSFKMTKYMSCELYSMSFEAI